MAAQYGFKVIWPLLGDKTLIQTLPTDQLEQLIQWQVRAYTHTTHDSSHIRTCARTIVGSFVHLMAR